MSASTAISAQANSALRRKIIRYAFGIILASAIAFGINWPVAFLTIVLANMLLLIPQLPVKAMLKFLFAVFIASLIAVVMSYVLLPYELIYTLFIGLVLLLIFYSRDDVISPLLKTWLLVCILVIPLVSLQGLMAGELVGVAFLVGTIVALVIVWLSFTLFPDIPVELSETQKPQTIKPPAPAPYTRFLTASKRTAVVYPVVLLFYYFEWQSSALILIYIAMYSSFPGFAKDFSVGKMLLVGCITGGFISLFLYEIVVLVPMYSFLLLLFLAFALIVGNEILGGGKYAGPIKAGFSTVIIVFSSAVGGDDVDAGGKMFTRVIQVSIVVIYLTLAFGLIEKLFPPKPDKRTET